MEVFETAFLHQNIIIRISAFSSKTKFRLRSPSPSVSVSVLEAASDDWVESFAGRGAMKRPLLQLGGRGALLGDNAGMCRCGEQGAGSRGTSW